MEVLIALAVVAIALSALIKATAQSVTHTDHIKHQLIGHWVAMQGVASVQLNLLPVHLNQTITEATTLLGEKWYWRATVTNTSIDSVQQIRIVRSQTQAGPFLNPLIAYRVAPQ